MAPDHGQKPSKQAALVKAHLCSGHTVFTLCNTNHRGGGRKQPHQLYINKRLSKARESPGNLSGQLKSFNTAQAWTRIFPLKYFTV